MFCFCLKIKASGDPSWGRWEVGLWQDSHGQADRGAIGAEGGSGIETKLYSGLPKEGLPKPFCWQEHLPSNSYFICSQGQPCRWGGWGDGDGGKSNDQCGKERMEHSRAQYSTAHSRRCPRPGERSPGLPWNRGEK